MNNEWVIANKKTKHSKIFNTFVDEKEIIDEKRERDDDEEDQIFKPNKLSWGSSNKIKADSITSIQKTTKSINVGDIGDSSEYIKRYRRNKGNIFNQLDEPDTFYESIIDDREMYLIDLTNSNTKSFFIPEIRNCKNSKTFINWDDTSDTNILFISYGFKDDYISYNIDELIGCFRPYGKKSDIYNYRIFNEEGVFENIPVDHGIQLINFLNSIKHNYSKNKYFKIIELLRVLNDIKDKLQFLYDEDLIAVNYIINSDKRLIKEFFIQLFNIGMYMRRWKGPGNNYPLKHINTHSLGYKYMDIISLEIGKIIIILNKLNTEDKRFINNLKIIQHFKGISRMSTSNLSTIKYLLDKTIKGNFCIRQASTFFIGTGAHYNKILFDYNFKGYDINLLDQIS